MNPCYLHWLYLGGAGLLLLVVFAIAPRDLLATEPAGSLKLCRVNVEPCQNELNLPVGSDAVLTMSISASESPDLTERTSLVGWFIGLFLRQDTPAGDSHLHVPSVPFRERGSPDLALNDLTPLSAATSVSGPDRYYRVRNNYHSESDSLEYGVTLVDIPSDPAAAPSIPFRAGRELQIGNLALYSHSAGTTRIVADSAPETSAKVVVVNPGEELAASPLLSNGILAQLNVGRNAEKARLQGRIWSDLPTLDNAPHPFAHDFTLEFWPTGSMPPWLGGSASPVATYRMLSADSAGNYRVTDLHPQVLPPGRYDLRVKGTGTLSVLNEDIEIDSTGGSPHDLPLAISVQFGPMPSGDLNGDNLVDEADLSLFEGRFGSLTRSLADAPLGDFNDDAVVDAQDFSLLAANFGRRGE